MRTVDKALWHIESRFSEEIDLGEIAAFCGVSTFHLCRAFRAATGLTVMRYLRDRRLTEAARALASGDTNVTSVAVEFGYGSLEAFTRAFRGRFGMPPSKVRDGEGLDRLELLAPIRLPQVPPTLPELVGFEARPGLKLIGLPGDHRAGDSRRVPLQWHRFLSHLGTGDGRLDVPAYGLITREGQADEVGTATYLCAIENTGLLDFPSHFQDIRLPARRYAVFLHDGHASALYRSWGAIRAAQDEGTLPRPPTGPGTPIGIERYSRDYDHDAATGIVELWLPLND